MAFKSSQFWHLDVTAQPEGFTRRTFTAKFMDPRSAAAALRNMADQIERECQLQYGPEKPEEVPLLEVV